MSLTAVHLRQTLTSDAILDEHELLELLPGDATQNTRWLATKPIPAHDSPSGATLYRWGDAASAYGLELPTTERDLLTVSEVAELLRVPASRIYQLTSEKRIPHLKLGHRTLRFDRAAILDWTHATAIEPLERRPVPRPRASLASLRRSHEPAALSIAPVEWAASE